MRASPMQLNNVAWRQSPESLSLTTSYKSMIFTAAHATLSVVLTIATLALLFSVLQALQLDTLSSHKQDSLKVQTFFCLLFPLLILYYSQIVALVRLSRRVKPKADQALRRIFKGHSPACPLLHYLSLSSASLAQAGVNNGGVLPGQQPIEGTGAAQWVSDIPGQLKRHLLHPVECICNTGGVSAEDPHPNLQQIQAYFQRAYQPQSLMKSCGSGYMTKDLSNQSILQAKNNDKQKPSAVPSSDFLFDPKNHFRAFAGQNYQGGQQKQSYWDEWDLFCVSRSSAFQSTANLKSTHSPVPWQTTILRQQKRGGVVDRKIVHQQTVISSADPALVEAGNNEFEISENPFMTEKQVKLPLYDNFDQEQSTDTGSARDSLLEQDNRPGDFPGDELQAKGHLETPAKLQLDQSSDDSQQATKQEQSKVDHQQSMQALMAHARNLDTVLESDDSNDATSTLMENFSWLELGLFIVNVLLYLSSQDTKTGKLVEQEDLQNAMVQNVLNYLYTVVVYMLSVSLILTAGSRIRRFLDAFDDLQELGLGRDDLVQTNQENKEAPTRSNVSSKPKRKTTFGLGGKQARKGVQSSSGPQADDQTPLIAELQVFLERVLQFVARQKMHDGEVTEMQFPASVVAPNYRQQSLLAVLDSAKFWGILVLRASFYFLNLCMLFVTIVYEN